MKNGNLNVLKIFTLVAEGIFVASLLFLVLGFLDYVQLGEKLEDSIRKERDENCIDRVCLEVNLEISPKKEFLMFGEIFLYKWEIYNPYNNTFDGKIVIFSDPPSLLAPYTEGQMHEIHLKKGERKSFNGYEKIGEKQRYQIYNVPDNKFNTIVFKAESTDTVDFFKKGKNTNYHGQIGFSFEAISKWEKETEDREKREGLWMIVLTMMLTILTLILAFKGGESNEKTTILEKIFKLKGAG
jgi:hypothetical protein